MKDRIPDEVIQSVLQATDIVEVVSLHVPLKKSGGSYRGLCPFHQEKSPSFHVHPQRRIYKCFGCGAGGDVISFLMKISSRGFVAVLTELAERSGILIPGSDSLSNFQVLLKLHSEALQFYRDTLKSAPEVLAYAHSRGLDHSALNLFQIGYSPADWSGLIDTIRPLNPTISEEVLLESGLFLRTSKGSLIDRFRHRLMFPIFDVKRRVIAFGARILPEGPSRNEAKYINSPETPLFDKGRTLYPAHLALADDGRDNQIPADTVLVVEGYLDAISLYLAGFKTTLAPLGTGFTAEHLRLLEQHFRTVVLLFDGDQAGKNATLKAVERMLQSSLVVKVVRLPEGQDPQDLIQAGGAKALHDLLNNASNALRFYCEEVLKEHDLTDRQDKERAWRRLTAFFQGLHQSIVQGGDGANQPELVSWLTGLFEVDEIVLRSRMFAFATQTPAIDFSLVRRQNVPLHLLRGLKLILWAHLKESLFQLLSLAQSDLSLADKRVQELYQLVCSHRGLPVHQLLEDCSADLRQLLEAELVEIQDTVPEESEYFSSLKEFVLEEKRIHLQQILQKMEAESENPDTRALLESSRRDIMRQRNEWLTRKFSLTS